MSISPEHWTFPLLPSQAKANFFQSRFNTAGFSDAVFSGPVQFGLAKFSGLTSFGEAVFAGEAGFNLARFSDAAYFSGAVFQKDAFYGLTKFEDIASFQSARFDGDLNFKGGSISTLLFEKAALNRSSRIILNDTDFARFKAHWKEIDDHVVWDPGAYLALVSNYHGLGWSEDEDDCYYQYRKLDQSHKGWGVSRAVDVMAWLSCGYRRPSRLCRGLGASDHPGLCSGLLEGRRHSQVSQTAV